MAYDVLDFYKTPGPTAWVERSLGDVLVILKSYEDWNSKFNYDDYIKAETFDAGALQIGMKPYNPPSKMSYNSWIMTGYSDWDAMEVPVEHAHRWMIMGLFGHREDRND